MSWKEKFNPSVLAGAQVSVDNGAVEDLSVSGDEITGEVQGIERFHVSVTMKGDDVLSMHCTCPFSVGTGKPCKHMAAVLLAWEEKNSLGSNAFDVPLRNTASVFLQEKLPDGENTLSEEPLKEGAKATEELKQAETPSDIDPAIPVQGELLEAEEISEREASEGTPDPIPTSILELTCEIDDVLTYAGIQNGYQPIRQILVKNTSDQDLSGMMLRIKSENCIVEETSFAIDTIRAKEELPFLHIKLNLNGNELASLTERITFPITIEVTAGSAVLGRVTKQVTALAFDQWPGLAYTPELLAAFIMPNHPVVSSLLQLSSKYLEKWELSPSLDGYQTNDPNHVLQMAAAAYAAIQEKNITYAEPPASFEQFGQRIRLADAVMDDHLGTCMDLTLLYAACLEAMGLNPILVMMRGHIFAGVWLSDQSFSELVMDDPSQLEKRMAEGIHEIAAVECTAMCAGKNINFDTAMQIAGNTVANHENFAFTIDVKRARSIGIRPLPIRIRTENGFVVQHEDRRESEVTDASGKKIEIFNLEKGGGEQISKKMQWERKLLDLSLRNQLISMRITKSVVPLLAADVSALEDVLSDGEEFRIQPRPDEMKIGGEGDIHAEQIRELSEMSKPYLDLELSHKKLHAIYTRSELKVSLTKIYRSAKSSLDENGASTLYLVLGLLRWHEDKKNAPARYAPIVLVPVDIVRKSANAGFALQMRDEDSQINITLLEFLKQNFDIRIPNLNPPPTDDHGLNLPKIFAIFRTALMQMRDWDVVETGFVGNFSFAQFVMWKDIHSNPDFLENSKIVHSLMTGTVDFDTSVPEKQEDYKTYLPVSVDASQLRAINMACAGCSFVLHGPPGTGKSQTITAMILNALANGKRVLFVAEKRAALEVVQKRLDKLGLSNFCLELHSNKATKKAVLIQLERSLETDRDAGPSGFGKKASDVEKIKSELDSYQIALHKERSFGRSLRDLMDLYETIPDTGHSVDFADSFAERLTEEQLNEQKQALERLVAAGRGIGHPSSHPLQPVRAAAYSQELRLNAAPTLLAYQKAMENLMQTGKKFAEAVCLKAPKSKGDYRDLEKGAEAVIAVGTIPAFLRSAEAEDLDTFFAPAERYLTKSISFREEQQVIFQRWNPNFLQMDMASYRERYDRALNKFLGKKKALSLLCGELQNFASFPVVSDQIPVYLAEVVAYQQKLAKMEQERKELSNALQELLDQFVTVDALKTYKEEIRSKRQMIRQSGVDADRLLRDGNYESCKVAAKVYLDVDEQCAKSKKTVTDLLGIAFVDQDDTVLEDDSRICEKVQEHLDQLKDWMIYLGYENICRQLGLGCICDAYLQGLPHDDVLPTYEKSIYKAMIQSVTAKEPALSSFTGTIFEEKIAQFKQLDSDYMELSKKETVGILKQQLPSSMDSVEVGRQLNILRRAIRSNGRGISIRSLFEQITDVLPRLCPCMLMSPISAAQYLKPENDLFDLVIFDEASQLPTCKAVGVIARGKNAVIVGDPNQMPPTSFFAGNTVDEDHLDIEDLDSILDDCLALGMPSAYLKWHYRSRHESLIAFSNHEFYENSMFTFPSENDRKKCVNLQRCDGCFERSKGRVNTKEAEEITHEIYRRYQERDRENNSIGVVTFNINQQNLIEDLLGEMFQKDPAFDVWANQSEEPLFVKNLENVQGDERDVILFSITYGPDENGKVSMNFGPLNNEGGWKRLNVAVTRARKEMVVFSTLTSDMIDLRRTRARGVEALRDFLSFAENGTVPMQETRTADISKQGILQKICAFLSEKGYEYTISVGHSKFHLDIGVVNPYQKEEYLLGILLDGDAYKENANTRDREISQEEVLEGLGWQIYRIWAMDWYDNKKRELDRLLDTLNARKLAAKAEFEKEEEEKKRQEEKAREREEEHIPELSCTSVPEGAEDVVDDTKEKYVMPEQALGQDCQPSFTEGAERKVAGQAEIPEKPKTLTDEQETYKLITYSFADVERAGTPFASFLRPEGQHVIAERIRQILQIEAPILLDSLVQKNVYSFGYSKAGKQMADSVKSALNLVTYEKTQEENRIFLWRKDQDPEQYLFFRREENTKDRRSIGEICRQEIRNALCVTLLDHGSMEKNDLLKETIHTMGYSRTSEQLFSATEHALLYARRTGVIVADQDGRFMIKL